MDLLQRIFLFLPLILIIKCYSLTTVGPGSPCYNNEAVCNSESYCLSGICVCRTGTSNIDGQCVASEAQEVAAGQNCDVRLQRCSSGTHCNTHIHICECNSPTQIVVGGHCVERLRSTPGMPCDNQELCVNGAVCGVGGVCECPQFTTVRHDFHCVERHKTYIGGTCTVWEACPNNSICDTITRKCICVRGFKSINGVCLPTSTTTIILPGGNCKEPTHRCFGGSQCRYGTCRCPTNTIISFGYCIPSGQQSNFNENRSINHQYKNYNTMGQFDSFSKQIQHKNQQQQYEQSQHNSFLLPPGSPCKVEGSVCAGGATCILQTCTCPIVVPYFDAHNIRCVAISEKNKDSSQIMTKKPDVMINVPFMRIKRRKRSIAVNKKNSLFTNTNGKRPKRSIGNTNEVYNNIEDPNTEEGFLNHLRIELPENEYKYDAQSQNKADEISANFLNGKFDISTPVLLGFVCQNDPQDYTKSENNINELAHIIGFCAIENAECRNHLCQCRPNFVQTGDALCFPKNKITNPIVNPSLQCKLGDFCDGGSTCIQGICTCPSGFIPMERNCIRDSIVQSAITRVTLDANDNIYNIPKYKNEVRRIVKKSPGLNCQQNPNICTGGSFCYNGYCVCSEGYDERNGECFTPRIFVDPGQSCDRPINSIAQIECTGNSVCANGFCVCPNGEPINNNVCVTVNSIAAPGETCVQNVTRCTGNAQCIQGVCQCLQPQVILNGQCATINVLTQLLNQPCGGETSTVCVGNSVCQAGRCQCLPNTILTRDGTYCQAITIIMQPVPGSNAYQCYATILPSISTTQQQQNPTQQSNQDQQMQQQATSITHVCPQGSTAFCGAGICICVNGQIIYDSRCTGAQSTTTSPTSIKISYAYPGQSCAQPNIICLGGSRCVQETCVCDSGYVTQSGICTTPSFVMGTQQSSSTPLGGSSGQSTSFQLFPSGVLPGRPGESCDPRCDFTGTCARICSSGAICIDGVCTCPQGTFAINGQCVPYATQTNNPQMPQNPPQATNTQSLPAKKTSRPSESCDVQTPCRGGSSCVLGVCQCPPGYAPSADKESCVNGLFLSQGQSQSPKVFVDQKSPQYSSEFGGGRYALKQYQNFQPYYRRHIEVPLSRTQTAEANTNIPFSKFNFSDQQIDNINMDSHKPNNSSEILIYPKRKLTWRDKNSTKQVTQFLTKIPLSMRLNSIRLGRKCTYSIECVKGAKCLFKVCACPPNTIGTLDGVCVPEIYSSNTESFSRENHSNRYIKALNADKDDLDNVLMNAVMDSPQLDKTEENLLQNLNENEKPNSLNLTERKTQKVFPGLSCNDTSSTDNISACALGASCLPLIIGWNNTKSSYCVCTNGTLANSNGRCVSPLLIDTKQKLQRISTPNSFIFNQFNNSPSSESNGPHQKQRQQKEQKGQLFFSYQQQNGSISISELSVLSTNMSNDYFNNKQQSSQIATTLNNSMYRNNTLSNSTRKTYSSLNLRRHNTSWKSGGTASDCPLHNSIHDNNYYSSEINNNNCHLPNCFCSRTGADIPGGLSPTDTPQMILLSFNGAITDRSINAFKALFSGRLRNPNGCPISATFFVSHPFNNYDQVQWLASAGHEIASETFTGDKQIGVNNPRRWREELDGMRRSLEKFSYLNSHKIIGVRAPHFSSGGDIQLREMRVLNFAYDSSIRVDIQNSTQFSNSSVRNDNSYMQYHSTSGLVDMKKDNYYDDENVFGPFWPQTLDFRPPWKCVSNLPNSIRSECPRERFAGIWQFPVSNYPRFYNEVKKQKTSSIFSSFDAETNLPIQANDTADDIYQLLWKALNISINGKRAPLVLSFGVDSLHALPDFAIFNALERFLSEVLTIRNDVYTISFSRSLEWLRLPTRLSKITHFNPWKCTITNSVTPPCENPSICSFAHFADSKTAHLEANALRVCGSCPHHYPTLANPTGSLNQ